MWHRFIAAGLISVLLLVLVVSAAQAHQSIHFDPYVVEYGWLNEPPVVGQSNAIVINVSENDQPSTVDISTLKVQASYGGDSKFLNLQPLGEDTPGQYIAPIIPAQPGTYTLRLSGALGSTPVQGDVQPEEVHPADILLFPRTGTDSGTSSGMNWLSLLGVILGATGTVLGGLALVRRKS